MNKLIEQVNKAMNEESDSLYKKKFREYIELMYTERLMDGEDEDIDSHQYFIEFLSDLDGDNIYDVVEEAFIAGYKLSIDPSLRDF